MKTQLLFHGALVLVAAVVAHAAWQTRGAGPEAATTVPLAELSADAVSFVEYTGPAGVVQVTPSRGHGALQWQVSFAAAESPPTGVAVDDETAAAGDGGPAAADAPPATPPPVPLPLVAPQRFPGGRTLGRALEALAPLTARRSLGVVPPERLAALGLLEPARSLRVSSVDGRQFSFALGDATYGEQARYARLEGRDEVLLLDAAISRGLEGDAAALMETRLLVVDAAEVVSLDVVGAGKRGRFLQQERDQPKKRHFVREDAPDQRVDEAEGVLTTLRGLRSQAYVSPERVSEAQLRAEVTLELSDGETLGLKLFEGADGQEYFAQVGEWVATIGNVRGRALLDDLLAAL